MKRLIIVCLAAALSACEGNVNEVDIVQIVTSRASLDGNQDELDVATAGPAVSGDGRYVAFVTSSANVVPGDLNGKQDVFRKDRLTGAVVRVSVDSAGVEGNGTSTGPTISHDGNLVCFESVSSNLDPGDLNGVTSDIFVRDIAAGTTVMVSVKDDGTQPGPVMGESAGASNLGMISSDGSTVAFVSNAQPLAGLLDQDVSADIFIRNLNTSTNDLVSQATGTGVLKAATSNSPSISGDGRYVSFTTPTALDAADVDTRSDIYVRDIQGQSTTLLTSSVLLGTDSNNSQISTDGMWVVFDSNDSSLAPGDTNGMGDVFRVPRTGGTIEAVSTTPEGIYGNLTSNRGSPSGDGRFIVFESQARNLIPGDSNKVTDVFLRDMVSKTIQRISVRTFGDQSDDDAFIGRMSSDGRFALFVSAAGNLVDDDANGVADVFVRGPLK